MSKYNAVPVTIDGIKFHSKREGNRWCVLKQLERALEISSLQRQVRYPVTINGKLVLTYVADFVYMENGKQITEDSKGFRTAEYKTKKRCVEAFYGFEIRET